MEIIDELAINISKKFLNLVKFFIAFYSGDSAYTTLVAKCSADWILTVVTTLIPISEKNPKISDLFTWLILFNIPYYKLSLLKNY